MAHINHDLEIMAITTGSVEGNLMIGSSPVDACGVCGVSACLLVELNFGWWILILNYIIGSTEFSVGSKDAFLPSTFPQSSLVRSPMFLEHLKKCCSNPQIPDLKQNVS